MKQVLIVDDDVSLAHVLQLSFQKSGLRSDIATDGPDALRLAFETRPDLVVLDVMLPHLDGWETCRRIKSVADIPILVMSCRRTEADILKSFRAGADDHIAKPFGLGEMNARVRALLRRTRDHHPTGSNTGRIRVKDLVLDASSHSIARDGQDLSLTPTEFRLLAHLMRNAGRLLTHEELLTHVWGNEYAAEKPYLMYYVRFLRRKLGDDASSPRYIATVRGRGYRLLD